MYLATVYPNRITVRYEFDTRTARTRWEERIMKQTESSRNNLTKKKTNWTLSYQSKRKIYDSVNFLHQLAPAKTIKTKSGKLIYNFKTSFITLTLPSKQKHPDIQIKSALNNFLTTLRQKYNLKNYIWKAELQQNKNIHFHLVTDLYIHHSAIRYYWNKAINVLGYVDEYEKKFSKMSLQEYAEYRNLPVSKAINGYLEGRKTKWKSPGTENVQAIKNGKMLSYYIAKYITKSTAESEEITDQEQERIKNFGRTWGRSQSLSKIKFITRYCWQNLQQVLREIDVNLQSLDKKVYDYCTIYFLRGERCNRDLSQWFKRKMLELGRTYNYPIPET